MSHFAIVFETAHVTPEQADAMVAACDAQVSLHLAPAWSRLPVDVKRYQKREDVPADGMLIVVGDTIDAPDALAYHTEVGGHVTGIVDAQKCIDNGGSVLSGAVSVSGALSHEICEAFIDPFVNASWADNGGNRFDAEVCDGVQDQAYEISGVSVSDFVLPAWCDIENSAGPFDHMGVLSGPLSKTSGGYLVYVDASGSTQQLGERPPHRQGTLRQAKRGHTATPTEL